MAICMSCSWNSGTPRVLRQGLLEQGVRVGDGLLEALAAADVGVDGRSLDGAGPDDGHLDHQVGEAPGPDPGQGGHLGPALHLEHPHGVGPAQHVVDGVLLGHHGQVDLHPVVRRAIRSTARCRASSIPSPSRSNLTRPTAAQSSLSHCSAVRPGCRAHSTGHTSTTGRSQMTIPPECRPRCRGKSRTSPARAAHGRRQRSAAGRAARRGRRPWPNRRPGRGSVRGPCRCRGWPTGSGR